MTALLFTKENVRSREVQWCAWEHTVTQHTHMIPGHPVFTPGLSHQLSINGCPHCRTQQLSVPPTWHNSPRVSLWASYSMTTFWVALSVYLCISSSTLKKKNTYFPRDSFPKNVPRASHCRSHPGSKEKQTEQPPCRYSFSFTSKGQKHSSLTCHVCLTRACFFIWYHIIFPGLLQWIKR